MKKRIAFTLLGLMIVVAALAAVKTLQFRAMDEQGKKAVPPPEIVTTAAAKSALWETSLTAVGSLVAVQGVTVATELPGSVTLPEGVEMVMPGDNVQMEIELISPIAMEKELRFAIREGGRTVGAGVVTEIIQ